MLDLTSYEGLFHGSSCQIDISPKEYPYPKTYLDFAYADLEGQNSERSRVNVVSNAKRALHYQVDLISEAYGFQTLKANNSFPEKLDFCVRCGVVGPKILRKLNRLRNSVEHDYYIPSREEAEDYVDIVELFLSATDHFIYKFPVDLELSSADGPNGLAWNSIEVVIDIKPRTGIIQIHERRLTIPIAEAEKLFVREKLILERREISWEPGYDIEVEAFKKSFRDKYDTNAFTFSVIDGEDYFAWIAFLNKKMTHSM